jgi:hypothetical protein
VSATNQTTELHLPLFIDGDKPTWLGDINGAMQKIDARFVTNASSLATANATILALQTAVAELTARVTTLESA